MARKSPSKSAIFSLIRSASVSRSSLVWRRDGDGGGGRVHCAAGGGSGGDIFQCLASVAFQESATLRGNQELLRWKAQGGTEAQKASQNVHLLLLF